MVVDAYFCYVIKACYTPDEEDGCLSVVEGALELDEVDDHGLHGVQSDDITDKTGDY